MLHLHGEMIVSGTKRLTAALGAVVVFGSVVCAPAMGQGGAPGARGGMPPAADASATRYINPGTLAALDGFTHAVRVGNTLYVSGQIPLDSTGALVGAGDLAAQARQVFENLSLVLRIAGAEVTEVVRLTIYVVNYREGDLAKIREAGAAFFPQRNPPAGVVVGVQALPRDGMLIAVDATAVIRAMFRPRR